MSEKNDANGQGHHVLSVQDLWDISTYPFEVLKGPGGRPCVLLLRRLDLLTQLMEDVINAPLLKAAQDVIAEIQEWIGQDGDFESAMEHLTPEKKRTVLEQLRHFACKAVYQPTLVDKPAAECVPGVEFPVAMLGADTLFAIWNHKPPVMTVPRLSEVAATEFRATDGAATGAAASLGEGLRPPAVGVGPDAGTAGQP